MGSVRAMVVVDRGAFLPSVRRNARGLSRQRPLPSIEILVPTRFNLAVQAKDVTWLPRRRMAARTDGATMLHVHDLGGPNLWIASFRATTQKSASPRHGPRNSGGPWLDVRYPQGQNLPGEPVHDSHQIEEAAAHRQIPIRPSSVIKTVARTQGSVSRNPRPQDDRASAPEAATPCRSRRRIHQGLSHDGRGPGRSDAPAHAP